MLFSCVFTYSWVPPAVPVLALLVFALATRGWSGRVCLLPLGLWLWLCQARPGHLYLGLFALLLVAYRLHLCGQPPLRTLPARALSYALAGYLGLVGIPLAAGVPLQIVHSCTACGCNLRNLASALELYYADHHRLPATLEQVSTTPLSCLQLPTNAATRIFYRSAGYDLGEGYGYRRGPKGQYQIWCNHRGISGHRQGRQPWYDSQEGLQDQPPPNRNPF